MTRNARIAVAVILLGVLCTALQAADLVEALRFQRAAIGAGELWRLLSAHLVHLGPTHLALNLAGLVLVALLVGGSLSLGAWGGVLVVCALATAAGLWWFAPETDWYVGLSGLLHGLLAAGAARAIARGVERVFHALLVALLALKLTWEQIVGALPGTAALSGGTVIVDAHLFGTVGGLIAAGLLTGLQLLHDRARRTEARINANEHD